MFHLTDHLRNERQRRLISVAGRQELPKREFLAFKILAQGRSPNHVALEAIHCGRPVVNQGLEMLGVDEPPRVGQDRLERLCHLRLGAALPHANIMVTRVGPVIGAHGGPGVLGLGLLEGEE